MRLLYLHALRHREQLELTPVEVIQTRSDPGENLVYVGVCLLSDRARIHHVKRRTARLRLLSARPAAVGLWVVVRPQGARGGCRQSRMTTLPNSEPESM